MGGAATLEIAYRDMLVARVARLKPTTIVSVMTNAPLGQIGSNSAFSARRIPIPRPVHLLGGGHRRGLSSDPPRAGARAIAGGGEALLTEGVMRAWESLGTLAKIDPAAPDTSCRPFAADRPVSCSAKAPRHWFSKKSGARARARTVLAEVVGYGNSNRRAPSQPMPTARPSRHARRLAEGHTAPRDVAHVVPTAPAPRSATSWRPARSASLRAHADRLAVSIGHGHLMGATSAVEFIAAVDRCAGMAPPTAHRRRDPECDLDYVAAGARALPAGCAVMSIRLRRQQRRTGGADAPPAAVRRAAIFAHKTLLDTCSIRN